MHSNPPFEKGRASGGALKGRLHEVLWNAVNVHNVELQAGPVDARQRLRDGTEIHEILPAQNADGEFDFSLQKRRINDYGIVPYQPAAISI